MARILTAEEKEALSKDANFKSASQWACRDYAAYWAEHDGSGLATEEARIKWAKDRMLSVGVIIYDIQDDNLALQFSKFLKNLQVEVTSPSPAPVEEIITALMAGNQFETLASMYFSSKGEAYNFTPDGN